MRALHFVLVLWMAVLVTTGAAIGGAAGYIIGKHSKS